MMQKSHNMLSTVITISMLTLTLAEKHCTTYPNYETEAYTYTVCNGTDATTLNTSREFCQQEVEDGDVVTYPNVEEYNFIISTLENAMNGTETFLYFIGIFQKSNGDLYNPETGEYFWVDNPDNKITNESDTYYEPLGVFIRNFNSLSLTDKQIGTFLLDLNGKWYSGESVAGGISRTPLVNGEVICVKKGIPKVTTMTQPEKNTDEEEFQFWIVIAVAGAVLVLGVVFGLVAYCVFKKMKHKEYKNDKNHNFHPVPQSDNHETKHQVPAKCDV